MTTSEMDQPVADPETAAGRDDAQANPGTNWSPNTPPAEAAAEEGWSANTPPSHLVPKGNWSPNTPPAQLTPTGNWSPNTPPAHLVPNGNWSPNTPPPNGTSDNGVPASPHTANGDGAGREPRPATGESRSTSSGIITQLWSSSTTPGVWALISGVGWKRLAGTEFGHGSLMALALLARANGLVVFFHEDSMGQIDELLV